ncbi:MAG: hypothetical protein ACI8W9_000506, partial [Psychromonas sp.]
LENERGAAGLNKFIGNYAYTACRSKNRCFQVIATV